MQDFEGYGKGMDLSISGKSVHEEDLSWGVHGQSGYSMKNRIHGSFSQWRLRVVLLLFLLMQRTQNTHKRVRELGRAGS